MSRLAGGLLAFLRFLLPALLGVASLAQGGVDLVPDLLKNLDRLRAQLRCSEELEVSEVELLDRGVEVRDPVEQPFVRVERPLPLLGRSLPGVVRGLFQGLL